MNLKMKKKEVNAFPFPREYVGYALVPAGERLFLVSSHVQHSISLLAAVQNERRSGCGSGPEGELN